MSEIFDEENGIFLGISDETAIKVEYSNKVELDTDRGGIPILKFYFMDSDMEEDDLVLPKRVIAVTPFVLLELKHMINEVTSGLEEHLSELQDMLTDEVEESLKN